MGTHDSLRQPGLLKSFVGDADSPHKPKLLKDIECSDVATCSVFMIDLVSIGEVMNRGKGKLRKYLEMEV